MDFLLSICLDGSKQTKNEEFSGNFRFGFWRLTTDYNLKTQNDKRKQFNIGIASDRINSQYEITINEECIYVTSEKFGLSPIFYFSTINDIFISSSLKTIFEVLKTSHHYSINKRYILEQNLFNYSLFNNTIYSQIRLLSSDSILKITDRIEVESTSSIENIFTSNPISYKKSINHLVDLFIEINRTKIQDNDYITFTSGFDGRCLHALSMFANRNTTSFSFGSKNNIDVIMPLEQSRLLKTSFIPIYLDDEEYCSQFIPIAEKIANLTAANSNILQLHWYYAANIISNYTSTVVMGLFGSELFRAAHITGQFTSPALVDFFTNIENNTWIDKLKSSQSLNFLNQQTFTAEFDSLIEDLKKYRESIIHLTESQRFYKYIFDEVYRKFFGLQIIQPMRTKLNVINPYIDWNFVKELLQSELAGVNNDFFTHNPFKRFKGHLFYAELLKRISPKLFSLPTGKGYAPEDLLSGLGKIKIANSYFKKKIKPKIVNPDLDNLGILSCFDKNKEFFLNNSINEEYYNKKYIFNTVGSTNWRTNPLLRDKLLETLSTNFYLSSLE